MKIFIIILILAIVAFLALRFWPNAEVVENNVPAVSDSTQQKEMEIKTKDVSYYSGARGFYAEPSAPSPSGGYPGVVMVHEWWGLNDNIKSMAKILAAEGYKVLAVDLYKGEVAGTADAARAQVGAVVQGEATANLRAAAKYLRDLGAGKVASLGWCFGGGQSLQLALSGEKLAATVIYYGTPLVTDKNELAAISWPVLGIFGDKDTSIPVEKVEEFRASLIMDDIKNEIHIYPGMGHAFANPSGANYAAEETADAWDKTLVFLEENLK